MNLCIDGKLRKLYDASYNTVQYKQLGGCFFVAESLPLTLPVAVDVICCENGTDKKQNHKMSYKREYDSDSCK